MLSLSFSAIRFLEKHEIYPIFLQSGLAQPAVDQVWLLADIDRDNRLTSKEFCAAFHMIICIT